MKNSKLELVVKSFEELTVNELYDMIRLREAVFVVEQNCVYLDCDNNDQVSQHLIATINQQIVGCLRIMPAGSKYDRISIGRVVVDAEFRGQKIAEQMMLEALEFIAKKHGREDVVLSAQVVIKELYKKVGFEEISNIYLEDGIDHVKMLYKG